MHTFHTFSEWGQFQAKAEPTDPRHYLPGHFIIELKGKKQMELLETPAAMAKRLGLTANGPGK
jgi:hypothetical protein